MPPTEAELRQAIATADAALAGNRPYPPELFPELARRRGPERGHAFAAPAPAEPPAQVQHARPVGPAEDVEAALSPENVARWSAELGFTAPARVGRITKSDKAPGS